MATYKLKKTDGTDLGQQMYIITVSFEDSAGVHHDVDQTIALPAKGTKAEAQKYADEFEKTYRPTEKDLAQKK